MLIVLFVKKSVAIATREVLSNTYLTLYGIFLIINTLLYTSIDRVKV